MDRGWWLLVLALIALLFVPAVTADAQSDAVDGGVEVGGLYNLSNGTQLWPYTSRAHDVETRTLPINIYVNLTPAETRDALAGGPQEWEDAGFKPDDDVRPKSIARWGAASGADRYAAVYADGSGSIWIGEEYQLEDGRYLGHREHVRIYGQFDGSWSALQAHGEYWDWFRLRHTVIDLVDARDGVVRDLEARGDDVTVIERDEPPRRVVLVGIVLAVISGGRRLSRQTLAAMGPGVVYIGIRATGIGIETVAPFVPPKAIVGVLYPFFLVGIPTVAYYSTRWPDVEPSPQRTFVLTAVGFASALVIDGVAMGITDPSGRLIALRTIAAVGIGLLAAGGTPRGRGVVAGGFLWLVTIVTSLIGLV